VGDIHFRNVSFAIFRDDQGPWSTLPVGRRGLVGTSILLGLRTLRWSREAAVEIGKKSASANPERSNLFFDDDHVVLSADLGQRSVLATLDTGRRNHRPLREICERVRDADRQGENDTTEVGGVGHAERFDSITLPELKFQLGGMSG
jgi:hypothetical protein